MIEPRNSRKPIPQDSPLRLSALHNIDVLTHVKDPADLRTKHTVILSLDGGGFQISWTLQLLKEMERQASEGLEQPVTCGDLFDVVTGSSAGAITAAFVVKGWSAERIENFWITYGEASENRDKLYPYRNPVTGAFLDTLRNLGLNFLEEVSRIAATFYDAPLYSKHEFRKHAREEFSDQKGRQITMGELCEWADRSLFLLNKDAETGYIQPLGCVAYPGPLDGDARPVYGYMSSQHLLVSGALEAATSPPLQMQPLGPFIDAGFGGHNNPVMGTITTIDRIVQGLNDVQFHPETPAAVKELLATQANNLSRKYFSSFQRLEKQEDKILSQAAAFAVGAAFTHNAPVPLWMAQNPFIPGMLWLHWFVTDVIKDSANTQNSFFNSKVILPALDFRNFNMSLSANVIRGLNDRGFGHVPGIKATRLHQLDEYDLFYLAAMMEPAYTPVYQALGQVVIEYMHEQRNAKVPMFASLQNRLIDYRPNVDFGDYEERKEKRQYYEARLQRTLGSSDWIEQQPTGKSITSYFQTALPSFEPAYFQMRSPLDRDD